ncbi:hypothetical protein LCGC14_0391560 [marine sediment metagenome]|uniref:Uncharacterized protein n=1 Tax=marine sediment metagenome TaxID=412755 RepID=A0A0F9SZL7_9ZZZZ
MADERNQIAIRFDADFLPKFIDMLNRAKIPGTARYLSGGDGDTYLRFSVSESEPGEATLVVHELTDEEQVSV